jgi:hypothetical protein
VSDGHTSYFVLDVSYEHGRTVKVLCLSVLQCPYNEPRVNGPEDNGDKRYYVAGRQS